MSGAEDFWRTIYLLSCPSSTGQGGDDAGFNIIHFGAASDAARPEYCFAIARYSRPRNDGAFRPLDSNLPDGVVRLPVGRDLSRDPAVQSVIEIASCASLKRDQVLALAHRLLSRRAFYDDGGQDWADILYTYLVTSHAWADLSGRFAKSAQRSDLAALADVKRLLHQLIGQCADTLGIERAALDELRADRLVNRDDLARQWPTLPREAADIAPRTQQRLQLLRDLNDQVKLLGLDLGLSGEMPPQGGDLPR